MKFLKILLIGLCWASIAHPMNSDSDREEPNFTGDISSDGSTNRRQPAPHTSPETLPQRLGGPVTQDVPMIDNFVLPLAVSQASNQRGSIFNPATPNTNDRQRNIFAPVSELDTEEENQNVSSGSESEEESEPSVSASPNSQIIRQSPTRRNAITPDQASLIRSISQESMLSARGISRGSPMDESKQSNNG